MGICANPCAPVASELHTRETAPSCCAVSRDGLGTSKKRHGTGRALPSPAQPAQWATQIGCHPRPWSCLTDVDVMVVTSSDVRRHGLSWPLSLHQVLSWVGIVYTVALYLVAVDWTIVDLVIFCCIFAVGLAAFFITSLVDPGRPPDPGNDPVRFCHVCNLHMSEATKHCRICNKCIPSFDHHCVRPLSSPATSRMRARLTSYQPTAVPEHVHRRAELPPVLPTRHDVHGAAVHVPRTGRRHSNNGQ